MNQWLKKAVLLSFRLYDSVPMDGGASFPGLGAAPWFDKVPLKTTGWNAANFAKAGFRAVPGSVVRRGSYIAPSVVLMPSFVNLGAYVDTNTMVDTWATVGSCAQIGKNCHLSGGVGIGGVLEPLQANPVIIEDNCFIGARSEVVEGVIVGTGAVLSMGVFISATTKVVDRATGQIHIGKVPPYSVVVPGQYRRRTGSSLDLLRRDREDGRRAHPLQDLDQRAAARLTVSQPRRATMPDAADLSVPLPREAMPDRLLWRGDTLAPETGRIALPGDVERELDRLVAALDRDPVPLLLLRPEDFPARRVARVHARRQPQPR